MNGEHKFSEDNAIGIRGERIFEEYCRKSGIPVTRVSDDPVWQQLDVDFVVHGDDGGDYAFEVKNDTRIHQTGNIFYEDVSNVGFNTIGCFAKTSADYIVICSESERKMYVIETVKLRRFVAENLDALRRVPIVPGSNSSGLLIPISKLGGAIKEIFY